MGTIDLTKEEKEGLHRAMNFQEPVPEVSENLPSPEMDQVLVSLNVGKITAHVREFAKDSTMEHRCFSPLVTLSLTEANLDYKQVSFPRLFFSFLLFQAGAPFPSQLPFIHFFFSLTSAMNPLSCFRPFRSSNLQISLQS